MRFPRPFIAIFFCLSVTGMCLLAPPRACATGHRLAGAVRFIQAQAVQRSPAPLSAAGQVDETLRGLEANYLRAEMEEDATLAGSILAEDFLGIKSDGGSLNRDQVLNNLNQHARSPEPYRIAAANMREHVFGDTACVTYTKIYTVPASGRSYSENVLHIFTQRNGKWQLQVSSPIAGPGR